MAISTECTVTNIAEVVSLQSIDRSIDAGFQLLADTMTGLFTPPKQPEQEIIPNGTLTIPYGTVSLKNDGQNNIVWTDKNGSQDFYGSTSELFVIGASVYVMGTDGSPYTISSDRLVDWHTLSHRAYNDLKSCALKIITANPAPVFQA